ncbi:Endo-1,3(4)-beta-glucanase [Penicillium ucsense]|uniref:Endo-1,3(4)-beta-glucanase n=1 Tax=Penicillium ucsense TaxID=2839758 RepID=A0A8J8WG10_9EURO|nr:Endo-1,3(4)-beta-glucanase [Penicillium ucsense]KAF7734276.1 Endo-1,3(4)-beta-glucanase [Penicillium ucsense]
MKPNALLARVLSFWILTVAVASSPDADPQLNLSKQHSRGEVVDFNDCDCFNVAGPDPGYFQHYKLWDFRSIPGFRQARSNASFWDEQLLSARSSDWVEEDISNDDDEEVDNAESDSVDVLDDLASNTINSTDEDAGPLNELEALWFFKHAFERDWVSQDWQRPSGPHAPITMINSKDNVYFAKNRQWLDKMSTYLILRTTRLRNYTSTAEIETKARNIYRCSLRVRFRILPSNLDEESSVSLAKDLPATNEDSPFPGACAGIFTYRERNCESDIELLTKDPSSRIHYANQPDYDAVNDRMIPGASTIKDIPVPWTTWSIHRLDWLSDISRWWVDDQQQDAKTYRVPNLPSWLMMNLWSDGSLWTGDLPIGGNVYMAVEYIELAFNVSQADDSSEDSPSTSQQPEELKHLTTKKATSTTHEDGWPDEDSEPSAEIIDGALFKKCKKGRRGRKCRKNRKKKKKQGKKPKHPHHDEPRPSACERMCNIDEMDFANGDVEG